MCCFCVFFPFCPGILTNSKLCKSIYVYLFMNIGFGWSNFLGHDIAKDQRINAGHLTLHFSNWGHSITGPASKSLPSLLLGHHRHWPHEEGAAKRNMRLWEVVHRVIEATVWIVWTLYEHYMNTMYRGKRSCLCLSRPHLSGIDTWKLPLGHRITVSANLEQGQKSDSWSDLTIARTKAHDRAHKWTSSRRCGCTSARSRKIPLLGNHHKIPQDTMICQWQTSWQKSERLNHDRLLFVALTPGSTKRGGTSNHLRI